MDRRSALPFSHRLSGADFRGFCEKRCRRRSFCIAGSRLSLRGGRGRVPGCPVTIFFGALNRDKEFEEILPVLNDLSKKYGKKLAFKILARKNHFDSLESENKILIGDSRIYEGQFVPYEKYETELYTSDIALLPL